MIWANLLHFTFVLGLADVLSLVLRKHEARLTSILSKSFLRITRSLKPAGHAQLLGAGPLHIFMHISLADMGTSELSRWAHFSWRVALLIILGELWDAQARVQLLDIPADFIKVAIAWIVLLDCSLYASDGSDKARFEIDAGHLSHHGVLDGIPLHALPSKFLSLSLFWAAAVRVHGLKSEGAQKLLLIRPLRAVGSLEISGAEALILGLVCC